MDDVNCPRELRQIMAMIGIAGSFHGFECESRKIYEALPDLIVDTDLLNWIQSVMLLGWGNIEDSRMRLQHSSMAEARALLSLIDG